MTAQAQPPCIRTPRWQPCLVFKGKSVRENPRLVEMLSSAVGGSNPEGLKGGLEK